MAGSLYSPSGGHGVSAIGNGATRVTNRPSPAAMLDALADAYRLDSGAVIDALREIGVVNKSADHDSSDTP